MKKTILIIVIVLIVIGIGIGIYFLVTQKKETTTNLNTSTTKEPVTNTIVNKVTPPNYERFAESGGYISFDKIQEWTEISPEQIQKAITEEQRNGYTIVYYSANPAGVVLAVSKKSFESGAKTLTQNFDDDTELAQKQSASYKIIDKKITDDSARSEAQITIQDKSYTIYSKAMMKNVSGENKDWYYIMEVSVPDNLEESYSDVTNYLFDSMSIL